MNETIEKIAKEINKTCTKFEMFNPKWCAEAIYEQIVEPLEKENKDYYDRLNNLQTYIDNHEEIWKGNAKAQLKQFAERLKEHPTMKIYSLHNACERIPMAIDETLKEFLEGQECKQKNT